MQERTLIIPGFEDIVGKSDGLLEVMHLAMKVAPTDTAVLILGESGTGKERMADCIHQLSLRKDKPFVKVNCAALPYTLIESELFGHEKGAFTGALNRRVGKFEKADQGTIFLDEIGELSLELQPKLLRFLQEKQFESIGGKTEITVDARIIAATNRDLAKEVAESRFRLDLYYRLTVFPLELPPLRHRMEDVPALAAHFIDSCNRKTGKNITGLSDKALGKMMAWHWPGNIRELENWIERSVLMASGTIIEDMLLPAGNREDHAWLTGEPAIKSICENERDHILAVLKKCNNKIGGPGGAAEILDIPSSTLLSKMKKLGIRKGYTG